MEIHRSARAHGIGDADILEAAGHCLVGYLIDDESPPRELRLGYDTRGRLLEVVVLLRADGTELVVQAMEA